MEHTIKRKIAREILIIASLVATAYVLTTLFADDIYPGIEMIKVQGIKHYLQFRLFGGIKYSYFFTAIVIFYCIRLTIWAVVVFARKQSSTVQNEV